MLKFLNNEQFRFIVKWLAATCAVVLFLFSFFGLWSSNSKIIGDYLMVGFVLYIFMFWFFLLPLIKSTLINKDKNTELEYKTTFIIQGVTAILLVYSSYMTFVLESKETGLWLWSSIVLALTLIVIGIIRILLKTKSSGLGKLDKNKVVTLIDRTTLHWVLIAITLLSINIIYDTPKVVDLDNLEAPVEFAVMKMDVNEKGLKSMVDRVYISDRNAIEDIINEIKNNKKVESIRGAEYVGFEKAYKKNDFYYWLIPFYDEYIKEESLDKGYFSKIVIQPNGYVVIEEEKERLSFIIDRYLRYKIVISQKSIDKIIKELHKK